LSHLVGFELMLQGEPAPDGEFEMGEHVQNVIGEINERFVEARRSRAGREVLDEFVAVSERSIARLRAFSDDQWELVGWSPEGDAPQHRFQETRILDSWTHLEDLRDALNETDDDHGPGEEVVVGRFVSALPYVIGRRVRAGDGTVVKFILTGQRARTVVISVDGGRARPVSEWDGDTTLELTTPVSVFWRRMAGRISPAALMESSGTDVRGERELAERIAAEMAIMI